MRPFLIQVTDYEIDLVNMLQKSPESGTFRSIRAVEVQYEGVGRAFAARSQEGEAGTPAPPTLAGASEASAAAAHSAAGPCDSS